MILVDTSIWVDHLRSGDPVLTYLLQQGRVLGHPFVLGELALGSTGPRATLLELFEGLVQARPAEPDEVLTLIARERLSGIGIGYVDAHLLAAVRLTPGASLWSRDRRLAAAAEKLAVAARIAH